MDIFTKHQKKIAIATLKMTETALTPERALELEQQHNVYIDIAAEQYNIAGYDAIYGWQPVPSDWLRTTEGIEK